MDSGWYNDCPEIRTLYEGCAIFEFARIHSMLQRYEAGKEFPELLIGNYDIYERERKKPRQISFMELICAPGHTEKILKESIIPCKIKR